jgi:phosphoglycerate dehydrogenase-like enzyme
MSWRILIPDRVKEAQSYEAEVFGSEHEIFTPCATEASEIPDDLWATADAILLWHDIHLDESAIFKLNSCKVIVRVGVGYDNVDLIAARKKGIHVCNVPDYGTNDVADHALAMTASLFRGLYDYSERLRESPLDWTWSSEFPRKRIQGSRLGIVGLGRIGTATALRAKAFGFEVDFHDPYKPDGYDKALGLNRFDELEEMITLADCVSFHVPLTDETTGMAGEEFFEKLKPGCFIVNTARGGIVKTSFLHKALKSGKVAGAALDVIEEEPLNPESPLFKSWINREEWIANRLILSPHCAFYCPESYREMRIKAAIEAKGVLEGNLPRNCVNPKSIIDGGS